MARPRLNQHEDRAGSDQNERKSEHLSKPLGKEVRVHRM